MFPLCDVVLNQVAQPSDVEALMEERRGDNPRPVWKCNMLQNRVILSTFREISDCAHYYLTLSIAPLAAPSQTQSTCVSAFRSHHGTLLNHLSPQ